MEGINGHGYTSEYFDIIVDKKMCMCINIYKYEIKQLLKNI